MHLGGEWKGGRFKFLAFNFFFSTVLIISFFPLLFTRLCTLVAGFWQTALWIVNAIDDGPKTDLAPFPFFLFHFLFLVNISTSDFLSQHPSDR